MDAKEIMSREEEIECARDCRNITHEKQLFGERRSSELADEFTRLEVQIATILFAFLGFFLTNFSQGLTTGYSFIGVVLMKITFAFIFFFLVLSLSFGLVHIKRKETFWNGLIVQRISRFVRWEEAVKKQTSFKEAEAFHEGTMLGNRSKTVGPPSWTWILQTICLGIAICLLFVLFLVFLFH